MSILIKGMEMPKKAYKDIYGTLWSNGRFTFTYLNNTISDYEVVEVPTPHGRLIDINDVKNTKFAAENINQYERWWNGALDSVIENAPTVIEAEEG